MKQSSTKQKVLRQNTTAKCSRSAGQEGIAFLPPAYGIDVLDAGPDSVIQPKLTSQGVGTIQRLIVNTGDDSFSDELVKDAGWIVGSDMDIAYEEGGGGQDVKELNGLASYKVKKDENIYLEGHGSAGKLGSQEPDAVANALNSVIPENYSGMIRSHSCSAGVGVGHVPSGVEALASLLDVSGIKVQGAAGIALNHMVYYNPKTKGTRAFEEGGEEERTVNAAIGRSRGSVDTAWSHYVANNCGGSIGPAKYRAAAKKATEVSSDFYGDLAVEVTDCLLPEKKSLTSSISKGSSSGCCCFITTACMQAKGLPDDCLELTTLRAFRDQYIVNMRNGKEMIEVYYENSPAIVAAINRRQNASEIYNGLYGVICRCVRYVQEEEYERAFQTYVEMVIKLRNQFTPLAKIPAFFYRNFDLLSKPRQLQVPVESTSLCIAAEKSFDEPNQ